MITSMTGFASVSREDDLASVAVTLKAVNHRYLDFQVRAPQWLAPLEPAMRALVQKRVTRGRVEMSVALQMRRAAAVEVELNLPLVNALVTAVDEARAAGLVEGVLGPGDLLRLPQALTIREQASPAGEGDLAAIGGLVERTVGDALGALDEMRRHEGRSLRADLDARRATLASSIDEVGRETERGEAELRARLARRVDELRGDLAIEPAALAQEVVKFVARSDISEELVRFRAHLDHWATLSDGPEPCGRKLDFLLQEMNREVNTIGSKAEGRGISELIVGMKAELEKMREQVRNVE
jgi:uncharacterized protein (TIGR00255 family)